MQVNEPSITHSDTGTSEGSQPSSNPEDRYFITALARGLEVLSCFRSADKELTNQQIAERCGLPKSTVTRSLFVSMPKMTFFR